MSPEDSHRLLGWGVFVCGVGIVLNLAMLKRRGSNAVIMAIAFLFMGITLLLSYIGVSQVFVYLMGSIVASLLLFDMVLRLKKAGERP